MDHDPIFDNRKNRKKLQGSNVWLNEDFPTEITQQHRKLYPIMIETRRLHKKASLNVDKLIVEGHVYTILMLGKPPVELSPAKVATKSSGEVTAFFTSDSPFSNFNDCGIRSPDGITYKWPEQFYQKNTSDEFGNDETLAKIISASSANESYKHGLSVKHYGHKHWPTKARIEMYDIQKMKYTESKIHGT